MPGRDDHLRQADRFEAFLRQINVPGQAYREWVVIVWFHIALHYVDAFLATRGTAQTDNHNDRWAKMANHAETRAISDEFHRLYKDAKEARYEGGEYTPMDLEPIERLYLRVRTAIRQALGI